MGETWPNVVEKVKANKDYAEAFKRLYGGSITKEKIAHAIAEFEKTLITPNSRFDKYLEGDDTALSEQEKKGFELFKSTGCTTCHTGDYFGGQSYQMMSKDYFKERGTPLTDGDMGRFNVTKKEEDRHMLKVPMLRNVAVTPPYYHDGSVKTLDEAVTKMAKYQLGAELKPEETQAIVAFLKTLTGEYKGVPLDQVKAAN
jgi:cytochrome c peroxidase